MARVELKRYIQKRGDSWSLLVVAAHIAFVFAPVYLAVVGGLGWQLIGLWLWFGLAMNGLLNLMHEASHYHVFRSKRGSDILGRWVLGPMAMADFDSYRVRHWNHHRHLGDPDDPKTTYHNDIHGWRIFRYLLRCVLLVEALKRFGSQTDSDHEDELDPPLFSRVWMGRVLIGQAVLAASLLALSWLSHRHDLGQALIVAAVAYFGVYGYGLASVTVFAAGMRAIAEHQLADDVGPHVGSAALRNFTRNPISWLVLGSYGFAEHATHHREPAIPYYRLPAATAELAEAEPALAPRSGYVATLFTLVRRSSGPSALETAQ